MTWSDGLPGYIRIQLQKSVDQTLQRHQGTTVPFDTSRASSTTHPIKKDPKKVVNASLETLLTVPMGHFLAAVCQLLGIAKPNSPIRLCQVLTDAAVIASTLSLETMQLRWWRDSPWSMQR